MRVTVTVHVDTRDEASRFWEDSERARIVALSKFAAAVSE